MKHPALIRDRILTNVTQMLERLRIQISMLPETEVDVLRQLERPQQDDVAIHVTNTVLAQLGHETTAPSNSYFDKTRRAQAKKNPRRGRGVLKPEDLALLAVKE